MTVRSFSLVIFAILLLSGSLSAGDHSPGNDRHTQRLEKRANKRLENLDPIFHPWKHVGKITIDSIKVQRHNEQFTVYFNPFITHIPLRYPWVLALETNIKNLLGRRFRNYEVNLIARGKPLNSFIPNYFRDGFLPQDSLRIRDRQKNEFPLVKRISPLEFSGGLSGNHIAIWNSHGKYYNAAKDRWQWQRARLFSTVEDIFPTEYVLQYIAPMLENAGANVLIPRERDFQTNEVIVDNDSSTGDSEVIMHNGDALWKLYHGGFSPKDTLFDGENPFDMGSHLSIHTNGGGSVIYVPDIPESGIYAVYISWASNPDNVPDVPVTVQYSGGSASFVINQQMGFATWIYLGKFQFAKGKNAAEGSLTLHTHSKFDRIITADAVRFGGGMGNVARRPAVQILPNQKSIDDKGNSLTQQTDEISFRGTTKWKTSGSPRFTEGSRYYLQYAGMPDTLVYSFNEGKNDYNDDFMSRGEWVNYLSGAPLGPQKERIHKGLNIPIDLSLAFHTDAGVTKGDSVIGTLAIYSAERENGLFPDGVSKLASRDLTDIIQDQIVTDIRAKYHPDWTRRAIWDRQYSEAWRPNVPAMLLELLSHQNLADMRFGLDPEFQFDVSRSIYKGILRFQAHQEGREAIIQPLPPQHMSMVKTAGKTIRLSWKPTMDPLEPSAVSEAYIVYTREEGKGFDQGKLVDENTIDIELPSWNMLYSFKVTAVNSGGESFPSEILSTAMVPGQEKTVLVVNGFQKISGPGIIYSNHFEGLNLWDDHAIPYQFSVGYTGQQYDFDRNSPWLDDDSPGWGASYADYEGKTLAGNTFDYPFMHGTSIRNVGYSFISTSRKSFEQETLPVQSYHAINLIMGKQKGTPDLLMPDSIRFRVFSPNMMDKLEAYAKTGGNIMITGAYIGTDSKLFTDSTAISFSEKILGYSWRTNNATNIGQLSATDFRNEVFPAKLEFATQPNEHIYHVEAPDAVEAAGTGSHTIYRYDTNASSAAIIHSSTHKVFAMGFPFETIPSVSQRDELMKSILKFFEEGNR